MVTLESLMKRFDELGRVREHSIFSWERELVKDIDLNEVAAEEEKLFGEFERLVANEGVDEGFLHLKIEYVTLYGMRLYEIAFRHNLNIFSEETVEELCGILAGYSSYGKRVAYQLWEKEIFGDKYCTPIKFEYPLWSLEFILRLNPSLMTAKSFKNLLVALDTLKVIDEGGYDKDTPDARIYFAALMDAPEVYAKMLVTSGINEEQIRYLTEKALIDGKVILEIEKYVTTEHRDTALTALREVCEVKPDYLIVSLRNQLEMLQKMLPFTTKVPRVNFEFLERNIERYGLSLTVGVALALGNDNIEKEKVQELQMLEALLWNYKPETQYYFGLAVIKGKLSASEVERLFSIPLCGMLETYPEYSSVLADLFASEPRKISYLLENSGPRPINLFKTAEVDRFKALMEKVGSITQIPVETIEERIGYLRSFEALWGNIGDEMYAQLLSAPDYNEEVKLWKRMKEERLYDIFIEDEKLEKKVDTFRNSYLKSGKMLAELSELPIEKRMMAMEMIRFVGFEEIRGIDVIYAAAGLLGVDPFADSKETIRMKYRTVVKRVHPDLNLDNEQKSSIVNNAADIVLSFVDYRDRRLKERFGTILPMVIDSNL